MLTQVARVVCLIALVSLVAGGTAQAQNLVRTTISPVPSSIRRSGSDLRVLKVTARISKRYVRLSTDAWGFRSAPSAIGPPTTARISRSTDSVFAILRGISQVVLDVVPTVTATVNGCAASPAIPSPILAPWRPSIARTRTSRAAEMSSRPSLSEERPDRRRRPVAGSSRRRSIRGDNTGNIVTVASVNQHDPADLDGKVEH